MSHDADPWPEDYAEIIIERLTRHFDARHDEHVRRDEERAKIDAELIRRHDENARVNEELKRRLDAVERLLGDLGFLVGDLGFLGVEIQRGATHTQILARETWAQTHPGEPLPRPPAPLPGAPRPKVIDEACAVSPGEPPRVVRLPRYGATIVPEPGSDPEKVWPDFIASINTPVEGSGTRGLRSSSRTRRR